MSEYDHIFCSFFVGPIRYYYCINVIQNPPQSKWHEVFQHSTKMTKNSLLQEGFTSQVFSTTKKKAFSRPNFECSYFFFSAVTTILTRYLGLY
jgi:hypothetical protein